MRRARPPLFAINPWPPLADGLTLALAVLVLVVLAAGIAQAALGTRLKHKEEELARVRAERTRIERRLRTITAGGAIAPAGTLAIEDGKVILQGEVLFQSGSDQLSENGSTLTTVFAGALDLEERDLAVRLPDGSVYPLRGSGDVSLWLPVEGDPNRVDFLACGVPVEGQFHFAEKPPGDSSATLLITAAAVALLGAALALAVARRRRGPGP